MLLDNNVIIYAAHPEHDGLRRLIAEEEPSVSVISKIETLGYHRLSDEERQFLEEFFAASEVHPVSDAVAEVAVRLRQKQRMTLGDALIAATAVVHDLVLLTRNVKDFEFIEGLTVVDPLADQ